MVIYPGQIVISLAGRDKNKYFVVLDVIDNIFCHISDGRTRKMDAPKKKKIKHLRLTEHSLLDVKRKIETGQTVTNSMIRRELKTFLDNQGC